MKFFLNVILICYAQQFFSQIYAVKRVKLKAQTNVWMQIDSSSIAPNSLLVWCGDALLDSSFFNYSAEKAKIKFLNTSCDSVVLTYRRLGFDFNKTYQNKKFDDYLYIKESKNPFEYSALTDQTSNSKNTIYKQGSIARGLRVGNAQDLALLSNLNLQLEGKISEEINIRAAITDQNLPIQPEGNTLQLQDFDRVFIELYNQKNSIIAGDFQIKSPHHHFLRYQKKSQGLHFVHGPKKEGLYTSISAAASRGKFARKTLAQQEGKQGPYALRGAENELFIIILSGTEKVFIDGKQLKRGAEHDYIIDYNTAQLTFTPKQPITKDKRVIIEFQYTDQSYARLLSQAQVGYQKDSLHAFLHLYTEGDLKNQSVNAELDDAKKSFLSTLGDDIDAAFFNAQDSIGYVQDRVLYEKIDSLGYTVYRYSTDPSVAHYALSFSDLGQGKGNYVLSENAANGKVYKWVKPDTVNGVLLQVGSFEPIVLLKTPKLNQMVTTGISKIYKKASFAIETALSNNNLNTFSALDNQNNIGTALNAKGSKKIDVSKHSYLELQLDYEFVHRDFTAIEWFRAPEFSRDQNINSLEIKEHQHLSAGGLALNNTKYNKLLAYKFQHYLIEKNTLNSFKHQILQDIKSKKFTINTNTEVLSSDFEVQTSTFWRNRSLLIWHINAQTDLGFRDDFENNQFFLQDSLLGNAYQFLELEGFIQRKDSSKSLRLSYIQRTDQKPFENKLSGATYADNIALSTHFFKHTHFNIKTQTTYRNLKIQNTDLSNDQPEETFLNRIEYNVQHPKQWFAHQFFYETASGFESRKEYVFVAVAPGRGNYTWIDYDSSGTQEQNEFEIAQFTDQANYVRVLTPSTEFIKTKNNQLSTALNLNLSGLSSPEKKLLNTFSKFSNQTAFQLNTKDASDGVFTVQNPFDVALTDTNLLGMNRVFRNTIFFDQSGHKFSSNYTVSNTANKVLSNNGYRFISNQTQELYLRAKLSKLALFEAKLLEGQKQQEDAFFSSRDFNIYLQSISPKISLQPTINHRISLEYQWAKKQNNIDLGGQNSQKHEIKTIYRYSKAAKINLELEAALLLLDFKDAFDNPITSNSSSIAFEMLEGLNTGQNILWGCSAQKTIKKNTQVTFLYNGRKNQNSKAIHTGSAEIRIFF